MKTTDATRATAEALPAITRIDDAVTKLLLARELTDLISMAGEGLVSRLSLEARAIVGGSNVAREALTEAIELLEAVMEGGAA